MSPLRCLPFRFLKHDADGDQELSIGEFDQFVRDQVLSRAICYYGLNRHLTQRLVSLALREG